MQGFLAIASRFIGANKTYTLEHARITIGNLNFDTQADQQTTLNALGTLDYVMGITFKHLNGHACLIFDAVYKSGMRVENIRVCVDDVVGDLINHASETDMLSLKNGHFVLFRGRLCITKTWLVNREIEVEDIVKYAALYGCVYTKIGISNWRSPTDVELLAFVTSEHITRDVDVSELPYAIAQAYRDAAMQRFPLNT
jgi:hypothetical protein